MVYQLSLVEREVNEILYSRTGTTHRVTKESKEPTASSTSGRAVVTRREVTEGDVCPICQDELLGAPEPVTFCK